MKLKYIPNALSIMRGIMAVSLIFIPPLTVACIIIFIIAGFTDMIDGNLARRIKDAKSELGATLDSIADLLMFVVAIFFILPAMIEQGLWSSLQGFVLAAISCKFLCLIPALIKHRLVFFTHTIPSKMFTLAIFLTAIVFFMLHLFGALTAAWLLAINVVLSVLIVYAFLIIIEEMVIISLIDYPEKNIKGFWEIKKVNAEYRERNPS